MGAGAEFVDRRAFALYTLWAPSGWNTNAGVRMGDPELVVTTRYRNLERTECGHYYALSRRTGNVTTVFWFKGRGLWAFGLQRPSVPICR